MGGSGYECELEVTHFTILDMDGDKIPEVVLELAVGGREISDFYEVLRYVDGTVYGYLKVHREFSNLKTDGTFEYSGGAGYYGIAKLKFKLNASKHHSLAYREAIYNNDDIIELYYINNKPVTEESFKVFYKEQHNKKDVIWYNFSQNNIERELSNNEKN